MYLDVSADSTTRTSHNSTIALFTARAFLPGLFERKVFLIVGLLLPLLDFATDCINAGPVLLKNIMDFYSSFIIKIKFRSAIFSQFMTFSRNSIS